MGDPAADIVPLYERHALAWLGMRRGGAFHERAWLDRMIGAMPDGRRDALDLGCGGGEPVDSYLAGRGLMVMGVDSSPSMIAEAKACLPDHEWVVADMRGLELGRRFGAILAFDSFFHLAAADQRAMFPVFAAHALPGAVLLFTSGPAEGEAIGRLQGDTLYHSSLGPDEYRALLGAHGFDVLFHVPEDAECGGRTVWLCRQREANPRSPIPDPSQ